MQLIKRIIRHCLDQTPYKIRRRRPEKVLPPPTFENVKLALAWYVQSSALQTFVQIGASDGVSGDSVHPFVRTGRLKSLLVEPVAHSFLKLQKAYQGVPNVTSVHAAVGRADGVVTLYKVADSGRTIDPFWSSQLASFSKAHILKHGVPEAEIESVQVPCYTLQSLLSNHGFDSLGFLQVDTEGFDAEVVKMALQLPVPPGCINFENVHLDSPAVTEVFAALEKHHYVWTHDQWNTLALRENLIESWSRQRS